MSHTIHSDNLNKLENLSGHHINLQTLAGSAFHNLMTQTF